MNKLRFLCKYECRFIGICERRITDGFNNQNRTLSKKGIIIDCVAVNQIENGYGEQVKNGSMSVVTYTVEVMDNRLDVIYQESCDTFKEALEAGVKWTEGYNSWRID